MQYVENERRKLVNNKRYSLEQLYDMILGKQLYFNEIGGYVDDEEFVSKTSNIQYDYEADKPYYVFDFKKKYFKENKVLWHIHPFQGERVWNCYPSYPDLQVMAQNPGKVFVLITKCGAFIYFSTLNYRFDFPIPEYEQLLKNVFYNSSTLNDNSFVRTEGYVILFYNKKIKTHEYDLFSNIEVVSST